MTKKKILGLVENISPILGRASHAQGNITLDKKEYMHFMIHLRNSKLLKTAFLTYIHQFSSNIFTKTVKIRPNKICE